MESPRETSANTWWTQCFRLVTAGSYPAQQRPRLRTLPLPLPLASGLPRIIGKVWIGVGAFVSSHLPYLPVFHLLSNSDSLRYREGGRQDTRVLPSSPASLSWDGEMGSQKNEVFEIWGPLSFSLQLQGEGKRARFGVPHPAHTSFARYWLALTELLSLLILGWFFQGADHKWGEWNK